MTAAALTVVLVASLTQAVASPLVALAVVRRDLPLMTSAPAPASDLKRAEPPQPKADFAPLAGKPASKEQVRAGEAAPETSLVGPVDESVVSTETPTLKVRDLGQGVLYCFKVSTGFDGRSGSVADSGCLSTPEWTVPRHVLNDGGRYTWAAATTSAADKPVTSPSWVGHFTVNQRVGDPGPAPSDTSGPVAVNLFNGNAQYKNAGPAFEAVGGSAGVTFGFNSRQGGEAHGVRASYFNDSRHNGTPDDAPVLVRNEPAVNLNTIRDSLPDNPWFDPFPAALDEKNYVIRWEGQFTAPVSGDFQFAGVHADGAKIWVNGRLVYDNPNPAGISFEFLNDAGPKTDRDTTLTAGQRVPIKVELYHHSDEKPQMVLWAKGIGADYAGRRFRNWMPQSVSTERLYAQDPPPLPAGWTLGLAGSAYTKAEMLDGSVVLTDGSGRKHTWGKASNGGYRPPPDEDGVLAFDTGGRISVTQTDTVSVFNVDGTLATVASVLDSKKPAALQYHYSGTVPRLAEITDPVSGRSHQLFYNTDNSDSCYGGTAKPPGADAAPANMLCRIRYWDGTETRLWYLFGTLARIENPGASISDYDYLDRSANQAEYNKSGTSEQDKERLKESVGPITVIRDPLAYDWLVRQTSGVFAERTVIRYQAGYEPEARQTLLRAVQVALPWADGRPGIGFPGGHSYYYDLAGKSASVDVSGLNDPLHPGHNRTVTYDDAGRALRSTDADGVTTAQEWNAKDKPIASVDARGKRSTIIYDHADRPTDDFGPAPASCFDGQAPTAACAGTIPHSHVGYDEGMTGLQAALYGNPGLSGVPAVWQTGVGTSDGSLAGTWGGNPPVANTDGWSGRFTGEIQFPAAGEYQLGFTVVDGVRLWIDDVLTVDSWTDKPSTTAPGIYENTTAGSWHRVRVDYYNRAGTTGALNFTWTPPGAGAAVTVPGTNLAPRYGNQTSNVTDSTSGGQVERAPSTSAATGYSDPTAGIDPAFGLVVSKTGDPGGLNLTRRNSFEKPGTGFLRQLATALPAGDITDPGKRGTTAYYGDTETRANPCDPHAQAVHQGGMAKTITAARSADGSANTAEQVYDVAGRVIASRINTQPWSCISYDTRGRVTRKSFPAMDGQPARTISYDHAVGGDPLTGKVSDESGSTTTVIDLLGHVVSYTDASGVTTTTAYDVAGRKTSETTTVKGASTTLAYRWTKASRLSGLDLDGTTVATPAYDAGFLRGVANGNQSNLAITYNDAETPTALTWQTPASTVTDTVTRSRDNRVTDDTIADTATPDTKYTSGYTYDGVGRLVAATVPHHQLTYAYAADGGCGPNTKAGQNSNRTTSTDSLNGAAPTSTLYCYDQADRLTSTSGGLALSFGYDAYGNATKIGTDTLGYDSTRRHITTSSAGRTVRYTRDVTDRITARTVTEGGKPAQVTRYGFTSGSGGPDIILDSGGNLRQRVLGLPGGVVLTKTYTQNPTTNWACPNIHGDILFTTDGAGARTGAIHLYDPFGQDIDPATGAIGDIPIPATAEGGMDFGYLGQHTVPIEHVANQQALEMGARTYLPALGRFLQTDPIAAGSANDYDYTNADPVNNHDLTGEYPKRADPDAWDVYDPNAPPSRIPAAGAYLSVLVPLVVAGYIILDSGRIAHENDVKNGVPIKTTQAEINRAGPPRDPGRPCGEACVKVFPDPTLDAPSGQGEPVPVSKPEPVREPDGRIHCGCRNSTGGPSF
ncbi:PA14 domain-containing protein [Streptomyces sp. NPDC006704]|uniref:PA14 domain-containing protein n=1 Tax=Streptomyces sp. NPDC006704 TaxID=3364760 RepID=UPI0036AD2130